MGTKTSKPVVPLRDIYTGLKTWEMDEIRSEFKSLCPSGTPFLDKQNALNYLGPIFSPFCVAVLERLFAVVDLGGDGHWDLDDFVYLVWMLRFAQREDKFRLAFNCFDFDGSGRIPKKNFARLTRYFVQPGGSSGLDEGKTKALQPFLDSHVQFVFHVHDRAREGALSFHPWRRMAEEDEQILQFVDCMSLNRPNAFPVLPPDPLDFVPVPRV